jgi:hypothetical protein
LNQQQQHLPSSNNQLDSSEQQQHQQQQHQQQQQVISSSAISGDEDDPFAENRAKKAAKRDRFLGREKQMLQREQLRALVPEPTCGLSSESLSGASASKVGAAAWGVKVSGASFFCKAAVEAATQWQVISHVFKLHVTYDQHREAGAERGREEHH